MEDKKKGGLPLAQTNVSFDWMADHPVRFKCTECGKCCTGSPGVVYISLAEAEKIAETLNIDLNTLTAQYLRKVGGKLALKEKEHYDCVFLDNKRCTIYASRPKQCQKFPFWHSILASHASWEAAQKECEGIDHPEGKFYTVEEIMQILEEK